MQKKLYFGTNLKMYKNISETTEYLTSLVENTKDISRDEIELFVIPSYTSLSDSVKCVDKKYIKLGAQNMCWEDKGQFTGEISPLMLKELDLDIVEIGHSERRHVFGETNQDECKKVNAALRHGFTALLCIGETLEEKEFNTSDEVLKTQLKIGLANVTEKDIENLWVAYEPVWAIGVNGIPASVEYAQEKHHLIKETLFEMFGEKSSKIPVLYGGSVNPGNANDLIIQPSIDGLFVGRSAWNAGPFNELIRDAMDAYKSNKI